jgi:hypothetical protein
MNQPSKPPVSRKSPVIAGMETPPPAPPSPENAIERLHRDIIKEIREVIVEILENALAEKHKG